MRKIFFYTRNINDIQSDILVGTFSNNQLSGIENWVKRTYFELNKIPNKPFEIILTDEIPKEGIIFFHKGFFEKDLRPNKNQYFICAQADHGRHKYAQMHLSQNPCQILNIRTNRKTFSDLLFPFATNKYIPNWRQQNIIPRAINRVDTIENVYFFGRKKNFIDGYFDKLKNDLKLLGLNLITDYDATSWSNYSNADIVLAIRDFNNDPHYHKPFAKLVNALSANSIVVGSSESSTKYFKKIYFNKLPIANDYNHLLNLIFDIKKNAQCYFDDVSSIKSNINQFSDNSLALRWLELFEISIIKYEKWVNSSNSAKHLFYFLR